MQKTHKQRSL